MPKAYISQPSPNYDSRAGAEISMLVLHYTGMRSGPEAIKRLCDPQAKVSAHYVVEEDGRIFALVEEQYRAWHAGVSYWRGESNVNTCSIGIELVNPGHEFGYRAFLATQMDAVIGLCKAILRRNPGIEARNVVAHSDVAPLRKEDPGELFDWAALAREGIGLWPKVPGAWCLVPGKEISQSTRHKAQGTSMEGDSGEEVKAMQRKLHDYGYEIHPDGMFGEQTRKVAVAFQRHFRPARLDGVWDEECEAILAGLQKIA